MKEIKDIISAYDEAVTRGRQSALATVVHVEGSSYRRPGARMLVTDEGTLTGAISGGCLEGDALRKALQVISARKTRLVTYDTNDEDDAKFGMGLGCNGIIKVLIEPIDQSDKQNPIVLLKAAAAKRQSSVLVTLFSLDDRKARQAGTSFLLNTDHIIGNKSAGLFDNLEVDAKNALEEQESFFKNYNYEQTEITAFIEFIKPPVSLVIAGAGNDVMPLIDMAQLLGWEVTVVDGRNNYTKRERFPSTCQVLLAKPEEVLEKIEIDDQTVFALMTHNYNYDMAMLGELLKKEARYIGLLGPKKKRDRMLDELRDGGMILTEKQMNSIYGPVGLDIGAETAEEIALSILAEIQSVLSGKTGKSLKDNTGAIHAGKVTLIEEKIERK